MKRVRVINLGLPKSGTTTLCTALRKAGLRVADYKIRHNQTRNKDLRGLYVAQQMYNGYFQSGDPLADMYRFDAFTEISMTTLEQSLWPQTDWGLITAIRKNHSNVRFVASRRDARALSDSMLRWSDLGTDRIPGAAIPGLPAGYGETTRERMMWIDGHYDMLNDLFSGADDFLEYDVADPDAPRILGSYLGLELPWWGRANANDAFPEQGAA